jgi:hypothetical protein
MFKLILIHKFQQFASFKMFGFLVTVKVFGNFEEELVIEEEEPGGGRSSEENGGEWEKCWWC